MNDEEFLGNLLSIPDIWDYRISLDKRYIAFSWEFVHSDLDVFYKELTDESKPIALTNTNETTRLLDFYPKSKAVLVTEDKEGNERFRLFRVNLDKPEEMLPLTEENPPYFMRYGAIHDNEQWIFLCANIDLETKKEIESFNILRFDLKTDERITLARPLKPAYTYPTLSKNNKFLLYTRKDLHPKGEQKWLVDIEGNEDRELLNFGEKSRVYADWLPDNKRVVFITDTKNGKLQNHYSIGIYEIDSQSIEWIYDDLKRNIEDFHVTKLGDYVVFYEVIKAKVKPILFNLKSNEEFIFPEIKGNLLPKEPIDEKTWIGSYYSSTQPSNLVLFNPEKFTEQSMTFLLNVWEKTKLTKKNLTAAKGFDWKGEDGLAIHGWVYKPKKPNGKTIIYVHGGPTAHSKDKINPQIQYYASKGFLVLDPNYRGSTGYGLEFEDSIKKNGWGSDEQNDILTGIRTLIKKGLAQKSKVGITGTSYGGYSSWHAITKAPLELIAASAPICGMTDLVVDYETTRPDLRPYSEEMLGGSPRDVPEIYYERSPINFIDTIKGKLLIIQGGNDPNVTPKNVEVVKEKLAQYKIPYELLVFSDEGHGIGKKNNRITLYKRIADFFNTSL